MNNAKLDNMTRGWFVGSFYPSAYTTSNCEVGVKNYKSGAYESAHYHKIATEITLILFGVVRMFDKEWHAGDIVIVEPGDVTDFSALTDVVSVVVKVPGAQDDKYQVNI